MSPLLLKRLSDEQLGGRLASGEAAAFDELYRRYSHRLAAYGAQLLGDGVAGDDVAQSALLKAYGALRDGRVPERVRPWLYRIAHNVAIDLVARRRELPSANLPERVAAPDSSEAGALLQGLASLPDRQRDVYVLRELHGLRIDETAAELGLTVQQVEQSLFAARNRLAEYLVFGDRLNCVAVRRLSSGPLDLDERRALKTHLRSCRSCRSSLGLRGRALGTLPVGVLEWVRALGGLLSGGGAPVAAKVGILVAGVSVAGAVPVAAEHTNHRLLTRPPAVVHAPVVRRAAPAHVLHAVAPPTVVRRVAVVAPRSTVTQAHETEHHRSSGDRRHDAAPATATTTTVQVEDGGATDGGGPGETPAAIAPAPAPAPAPTTTTAPTVTTDDGGSSGSSDGSSGSSGSDGGGSGSSDGGSSGPD